MRANKKYKNINSVEAVDNDEANKEIVKNWQKKHKSTVDEHFKYERKNVFIMLWVAFLRLFAVIILVPFNYFVQHMRIKNRKNFMKVRKKGCIIVNNHCMILDSVMISSSLSKGKTVHPITLKANFDVPIAGRVIRWLGAIPIPQNNPRAMRKFIQAVEHMLDKNKVISICPEGSLWPEYKGLRTFQLGAFHFACKTNKPIVPVVYTFTKRKTKWTRREKEIYNIKMHVLPAEYPDQSLELSVAKRELAERVFDVMAKKIIEQCSDIEELIWKEKYSV